MLQCPKCIIFFCCYCWRIKANRPLVRPGPTREVPFVGGLSKWSKPVFRQVLEETTENSECLGLQVQLCIEPGTFRLPVLSAEPLGHWWGCFLLIFRITCNNKKEYNYSTVISYQNCFTKMYVYWPCAVVSSKFQQCTPIF